MNRNIILALIVGILSGFSANSSAGIGLIKICKASDAPASPHGTALVSEHNVAFYQTPAGDNDGSPSIVVADQVRQEVDARGAWSSCAIATASLPGSEGHSPLPKKGDKWYRVAIDEGWSSGQKVSVKVPLVAEAVEDFIVSNGQITVCRMHGITGSTDGKRVEIPADTYTGACDRNGEHCRNIQLKGEKGILGLSKSSCITVNAELIEADGKPIKKGERLLEQWSVPGFTPSIRTATDFK
jgi:hypothetical protein